MGLACICNTEGLVSCETRLEARSENAIRKCDSNRCDSQVLSTSAIQKCDQEVRLTSVIDKYDSKVRSTVATHKRDQQLRLTSAINSCDSQVRSIESWIQKFLSLQVCKFGSLKKLESLQVRKFALKKHKKSKKLF